MITRQGMMAIVAALMLVEGAWGAGRSTGGASGGGGRGGGGNVSPGGAASGTRTIINNSFGSGLGNNFGGGAYYGMNGGRHGRFGNGGFGGYGGYGMIGFGGLGVPLGYGAPMMDAPPPPVLPPLPPIGRVSAPAPSGPGTIAFSVPDNALVWVNGLLLDQTGGDRDFATPALEAGTSRSYLVRVKWTENGEEKSFSQKVWVRAGSRASVTIFGRPTPEK